MSVDAAWRASISNPKFRAATSIPDLTANCARIVSYYGRELPLGKYLQHPDCRTLRPPAPRMGFDETNQNRPRPAKHSQSGEVRGMSETIRSAAFAFPAEASAMLRSCVHCGLCLQSCPTLPRNRERKRFPARPPVPDESAQHWKTRARCRSHAPPRPLPRLPRVRNGLPQRRSAREKSSERARAARAGGVVRREFSSERMRAFFFGRVLAEAASAQVLLGAATRFQQRSGLRRLVKFLPRRAGVNIAAMQPEVQGKPFPQNAPDVFPVELTGGTPVPRLRRLLQRLRDERTDGRHPPRHACACCKRSMAWKCSPVKGRGFAAARPWRTRET